MKELVGPLVVVLGIAAILPGTAPNRLNYLEEDSHQFLEFAADLSTGRLFDLTIEPEMLSRGTLVRTPGYPLLLAFGQRIFPDDLWSAVIFGNLVVAVLVTIALLRLLRPVLSPMKVILLLLPVNLAMYQFFSAIVSEWLAFQLLLLLFGILVRFLLAPSALMLFLFCGVVSGLVLTRSALTGIVILPLVLLPFARRLPIARTLGALTLGFLPLILWVTFNTLRLDRMTIAPA